MIQTGEFEANGIFYNRCLELTDWRFSATAIGLIRFCNFHNIDCYKIKRKLFYNFEDVDLTDDEVKKKYLIFAEDWFAHLMHHRVLIDLYNKANISKEDEKKINEKFVANTIMKNVFKGIKYGDIDVQEVIKRIDLNSFELIVDTFNNPAKADKKGYKQFINSSCFCKPPHERCRLLGFYVDIGRKTKSLGFNFDKNAATSIDFIEFDFIPFAFSKGRESVFINNNSSIRNLLETNDRVQGYYANLIDQNASWNTIFYSYLKSSKFIRQDVEVILKNFDNDYYESIIVRERAIEVFLEITKSRIMDSGLSDVEMLLKRNIKIRDNYYMSMSEIVTNAILNDLLLDYVIERVFEYENKSKDNIREFFCIKQLIKINVFLYKHIINLEVDMVNEQYLKSAYRSAKEVTGYFKVKNLENKTKSYRQRLINSIVAKDYDRFIEIMLQLSSYTEISFNFLHDLIKDFEANKNLAYEFINSLGEYKQESSNEEKKIQEVK